MPLNSEVRGIYNSTNNTTAVRYVVVPAAAGVALASGAPGAMSIMLADAAVAVDLWVFGACFEIGVVATSYTVALSTPQAGSNTTGRLAQFRFSEHTLAAVAANQGTVFLPVPIKIIASATNGIAANQLLASGQTVVTSAVYATGLDG